MDESSEFASIVNSAIREDVEDAWISNLAMRLASSGEIIKSHTAPAADIPSTGGPSSLTTLLCPLYLSSEGWLVPKLGVPGRPAGGLDVMAQINGYQTELDSAAVRAALAECRYAHFDAIGRIAPMDRRLFAYRQAVGAQSIIPLVIASLLSKKVAVGVTRVGLDIRVAKHGNFGTTRTQARHNASRFIRVAALLGIEATCFVTDATQPYQPYIGRGESLLALDSYFQGDVGPWLLKHIEQCLFMASTINGKQISENLPALQRQFELNLVSQGSTWSEFESTVTRLGKHDYREICARQSGYINFDLERIRNGLVNVQIENRSLSKFPDPAGVVLLVEPETFVEAEQPVMRIRNDPRSSGLPEANMEIENSFSISQFPKSFEVDVINA